MALQRRRVDTSVSTAISSAETTLEVVAKKLPQIPEQTGFLLKSFKIDKNHFLSKDIDGYYRSDYYGYKKEGNPDYLVMLKNDFRDRTYCLKEGAELLLDGDRLRQELRSLLSIFDNNAMISIVPRSKANLLDNQRLFYFTIKYIVKRFFKENDGTDYIIRYKDTKTTHLNKSGYGGEGDLPYPGISKDTCIFSEDIKGKNIILIDDLYTKTINIIEDMVQSLLDHGAKNVIVFTIGYTVFKQR
ncbi:phosphoribosyltransferase [Volucribacter amazonae]|uniref:Uncharacterized protein n=1 Tax=Volucribacter amazonae TaxID=256731 RepID=A0A9X4SIT1_9PAST|nr:hypothetical protein [Volucribacter amazonae]MDG6895977.1 hypothetical protein [Volucribacter amazonae]